MRKVVSALLVMIILSACSSESMTPNTADPNENEEPQNIPMFDEGVWPVNTYTNELPVPPGTVSWAMLDTEHENCCINLADMSETDFNDYVDILKQEGFSVIEDTSEEVKGQDYISVAMLLSNEKKELGISYARNNFVICISFI